jgi:hypothetical protein
VPIIAEALSCPNLVPIPPLSTTADQLMSAPAGCGGPWMQGTWRVF